MSKKYPKKPEQLDADCLWVSVAKVIESSGVRDDELAWCCEYVIGHRNTLREIARDAALVWYSETDQSCEAQVVLRFERQDGKRLELEVRLAPVIRATVDVNKNDWNLWREPVAEEVRAEA